MYEPAVASFFFFCVLLRLGNILLHVEVKVYGIVGIPVRMKTVVFVSKFLYMPIRMRCYQRYTTPSSV